MRTVARLKAGVSLEAAREDMARIAADLAREYPATNEGRSVALEPMRDTVLGGELQRTSMLLLGVVGFVLLVCLANVANLLLARNAARSNELAIRSVLGADRRRLVRQFATENLLLATIGGLAGIVLAAVLLRVAPAVLPRNLLPSGVALDFDWRVAVFCAAATLLVALLFTLASGRQIADLTSLREGLPSGRGVTDRASRMREVLVVGQVATAVVLLYGAGLLARTLIEVDGVDPGYRAPSVLSMVVDPLSSSYPTPEALLNFYGAIEEELKTIPNLASAAWTTSLPLGPSMMGDLFFDIAGESAVVPSERPMSEMLVVSKDYFRTLDQPILAGRAFDETDRAGSVTTCIVNEAFVERRLQDGAAIGRTVQVWREQESTAEPRTCEIVGVATNAKRRPDEFVEPAQIYFEGIAQEATARYRFRAILIAAFAGLALVLAALGLFGVLAYTVQKRWREFGVRMALGARPEAVVRHIVHGAARLLVPGMVVGAVLAVVVGQFLSAMLFGVRPLDAVTFTIVVAVLVLTAVAAVAGPAFRATRIDPVGALRSE